MSKIINCPLHGRITLHYCQNSCDWYDTHKEANDTAIKEGLFLTCGWCDESVAISDSEDIDVIKLPESPELRPCEPTRCVAQSKGGG